MPENKKRDPKHLKVSMDIYLTDESGYEELKKWEHHIEWGIDLEGYPEIDHIENVSVEQA